MISEAFLDALPHASPDQVFHVGPTTETNSQGNRYEGAGLSVNLHRTFWGRHSRLEGLPHWILTPTPSEGHLSAAFLLANSLTPSQLGEIEKWAISEDLLVPEQRQRVEYFREDLIGNRVRAFTLFTDVAEAQARIELETWKHINEPYGDDEAAPTLAVVTMQVPTAKMLVSGAIDRDEDACAISQIMFAEDHGFAGVLWDQELFEGENSGPSGVICLSRLNTWCKEMVQEEYRAPSPRM